MTNRKSEKKLGALFMAAFVALATGCSGPAGSKYDCPTNCFRYVYTPSGGLPETCTATDGSVLQIPFTNPEGDGYIGEVCPSDHNVVLEAVAAIALVPEIGGVGGCIAGYDAVKDAIADDAYDRCIENAPEDSEEFPGCVESSYEPVCVAIHNAIDTDLADLSGLPEHYEGEKTVEEEDDCDFMPVGTGGQESECSEPPPSGTSSGGGADDESGGSSTTTGEEGSIFDDAAAEISCGPAGTLCYVTDEFYAAVFESFDAFYADGVHLEILGSADPDYPGLRLSGVDPTDVTYPLFEELDVEDGDIIKVANGVTIVDMDDALEALSGLLSATGAALELERKGATIYYRLLIRG